MAGALALEVRVSQGLQELADETLLQRYVDGDAAAFEELLERYERPVYNFVLRSVRDRGKAAELTQDVFLRIIQRAAKFEGKAKFSTWMYTIARNLCIDTSRKMVHRRHKSLDQPTGDNPTPMVERVGDGSPGTARTAISGQLRKAIGDAVETLPDDQREVFLLRHVHGLPFKEIARIVGTNENTIKSRMRYALERLQQSLDEYRGYVRELT